MRSIRVFTIGLLGLSVFAAEPARQRPQVTTTERVDFAPGGTIHIEDAHGCVSVEGWDRPEVELVVTRSEGGLYGEKEHAKLTQDLQKVQVKLERKSDKELTITTHFPAHYGLFLPMLPPKTRTGVDMEYMLRVPRTSHLQIRHKDGDVLITDVTGEIEATSRSGDIVVMLPESGKYAIDARTRIGTIYSDFDQAKHSDLWLGEKLGEGAGSASRVYLRMGVGGISIQRLNAAALATQ